MYVILTKSSGLTPCVMLAWVLVDGDQLGLPIQTFLCFLSWVNIKRKPFISINDVFLRCYVIQHDVIHLDHEKWTFHTLMCEFVVDCGEMLPSKTLLRKLFEQNVEAEGHFHIWDHLDKSQFIFQTNLVTIKPITVNYWQAFRNAAFTTTHSFSRQSSDWPVWVLNLDSEAK